MTMLPDVPEDDYRAYQADQFNNQIDNQISGLGFEHAANAQIATLIPPSPPPEVPAAVAAAQAQYAQPAPPPPQPPAPEPPPQPPAEPEPPPTAEPPQPPPPAAAAPPPPPPPAAPTPPAPQPSGIQDWFANTLNAVGQVGGDVQQFASNFDHAAQDKMSSALTAAAGAGADVQAFASNLAPPPAPPPAAPPSTPPPGAAPPGGDVAGVPAWLTDLIQRNAPPGLASDPDFIRTVAASAKAESGWDPNKVQNGFSMGSGAGARGLFQFDMGGMGKGMDEASLLGQQGAEYQASKIIPLYAQAYASAPAGLSGADKASWVASRAERPLGMDDPNSAARQNYQAAYNQIGGNPLQQVLGNLQAGVAGAKQAYQDISQFGDQQLSAAEAMAACRPAAAVRFAERFGRNPTLLEATDLASSVGWTAAGGMAGLGSEKALMDKLGVQTHMVGGDLDAIAQEAATGNPVTISTPGHYFFADGYDPNTGAFHVGQSGLDLRGGSEWMTPAQMQARMGQIQGALFSDNASVPAPSTAGMSTNPAGFLDRAKDSLMSTFSDLGSTGQYILQSLGIAKNKATDYAGQSLDNAITAAATPPDLSGANQLLAQSRQALQPTAQSIADVANQAWNAQPPEAYTSAVYDNPLAQLVRRPSYIELQGAPDPSSALGRLVSGQPLDAADAAQGAWEGFQNIEDYRQKIVASDIPQAAKDIPLLGGALTMTAQMFTDPAMALAGPLLGRGAALAGDLAGGTGLTAAAARGAVEAAGYSGLTEAERPGATPQEIALQTALGIPLGGALGGGSELVSGLRSLMRPGQANIVESLANYAPGGLEDRFDQAARASAAASPDGLAHLDLANLPSPFITSPEALSDIKGAVTSVHIPHLDDIRAMVQNGLPFGQWYTDMAEKAADGIGAQNLPEFATNFGITSQRTRVEDNLAESLRAMRVVREAASNAIDSGQDPRAAALAALGDEGTTPLAGLAAGQKRDSLVNAYTSGAIPSAGPKTPSYIGNLLSAFQALYDPRTTNDTWIAQMMGVRGDTPLNRYANNDQAYRFAESTLNEISREMGIPGHQAQAAAWYSMQRLREAAPDLFHSIGVDRGVVTERGRQFQTGGSTLGDALRAAQDRGIFQTESTGQAGAWDMPKVQAELDKLSQLPDSVRFMDNPTGADMMRRYAGKYKGAERVPSSPEYRQQERIAAESGAETPTVQLPALPTDTLREQGLLNDNGLMPALRNIPHRLSELPDGSSMISLPGGNSDTARYVASLFGDALGADRVPITYPKFDAEGVGGFKTIVDPSHVDEMLGKLSDIGAQAAAGTDRGSIHIPMTQSNEAIWQDIADTLASAGDRLKSVSTYQGEASHVEARDFGQILQGQTRNRFAPTGPIRPDLLERTLGVLRQAGGVGQAVQNILPEATGQVVGRAGRGAVQGAIASGYQRSQQPGATPQDVALAALQGAGLGAVRGSLGRMPVGPMARAIEEEAGPALTEEAMRLLQITSKAGVPAFMTNNLRRIAEENGVRVGPETTPNQLINSLRGRMNVANLIDQLPSDIREAYGVTSDSLAQAGQAAHDDMQRVVQLRDGLAGDTAPRFDNAGNPVGSAAQALNDAYAAREAIPAGTPELEKAPLPAGAKPIDMTPEEQLARLNLGQYPEAIRQTLANAAQNVDWANGERRGVIPDAVAENLAREYANHTSLDDLIAQHPPGQAYNTEQLRAMRNAIGGQGVKVADLAKAIQGGDDSTATLGQWLNEGDKLQRLMQMLEGGRAEMGRGMRAFAQDPSLINLSPGEATAKIVQNVGRDNLMQAIGNYQQLIDQGANPMQLAKFWQGIVQKPPTAWDWYKALRYNSMISGAPTVERIGIGGALENLYAGLREGGGALLTGHPGEAAAVAKGAALGFKKGSQNAMQTLVHGINEEQALAGGFPRGIAARVQGPQRAIATALEAPGRLHSALQDITQGTAYGMRSYQRWAQKADALGLSGKDAAQYIADGVGNAALTPEGRAIMRDSQEFAQRAAMRGEMGSFGQALSNLGNQGGPIGHVIMPFARVAYNQLARGIDTSPVGLLGTAIDVARTGGRYAGANTESAVRNLGAQTAGGLKGVRPFRERLQDNVIGSLLSGAAYYEALQGNVTGSGPQDQNRLDELKAGGWQPYSLRIGGNYVPYRLLGRWGVPLALAASAAEAQTYAKGGQQTDDPMAMLGDAARRTGDFAANETYLSDLGDAMRGLQDPARYGNSFISNFAASHIPYGALLSNIAQGTGGPRQVQTAGVSPLESARETAMSRIPGLSGQLPQRQDVLGRPMPTLPGTGWAPEGVSPGRADPILTEMMNHGVTVPATDKVLTARSGTAEVNDLSPEEQRMVQARAGYLIQQAVRDQMADPSYATSGKDNQGALLARAVANAHAQAEQEMLSRINDQTPSRLKPARKVPITVPQAQRQPLQVP